MESHYILRIGGERSIALETLDGNPVEDAVWRRVCEAFDQQQSESDLWHFYDAKIKAGDQAQREAQRWLRVGHKIRTLRDAKGWSQEQLAKEAEMIAATLQILRTGRFTTTACLVTALN